MIMEIERRNLGRGMFCACQSCMDHDFTPGACLMSQEFGRYKIEYARRAVARDPRVTRTQALEEFAAILGPDQVSGSRVLSPILIGP